MRYEQQKVISGGSMAGAITSSIIDLRNVINLSLIFSVTSAASPTGTIAILFADDCTLKGDGTINQSSGTFGADPAVTAPTLTANGVKALNISETGHLFCKLVYTAGTGSGTLDVFSGTKGA